MPPALSAWISVSSESPAVLAPDDSSLKSLFPSGLSHVLVLGQLASSPSVCSLMHLCGGACPRAAAGLRLGGGSLIGALTLGGRHRTSVPEPGPHRMDMFFTDS